MSDIPKLVEGLKQLVAENWYDSSHRNSLVREAIQALEQMAKDIEIYAIERERQAKRAEIMLGDLVAITNAILPDKISVDGVTYEYVPPDPHMHLRLLSKAIKAARERTATERDAARKAEEA